MVKELIQAGQEKFEQAVEHFVEEAAKLRTGRANPALLEGILVDYYGTRTALNGVFSSSGSAI